MGVPGALDEPALVLGNVVPWRPTPKLSRVDAPVDTPPLVVLPGFGNCSKDYECPNGNPDDSMVAVLRRRGFRVYVAQVERRDWLNVGRAILSRKYWVGLCTVDPGYRWYLERIQQAVHLVGHSAGGWLGRAFVADPLYFDSPTWDEGIPHQGISSLVTLGTPHVPPLATSGRDMTGGALTWVNLQWPGAHFADKGVGYMCVAGCAVQADRHAPRNSIERYAHSSYSQVCGDGHGHMGDCVVPVANAHLQGANNLVLEGVFHSMGTHKGWPIEHRWYGSNDVVDHWAHCLVTQ
ncbi:hypothetical protein COCSUDRAFT_35925 [Coccomyxa subellipsoidea C-169]|uniref:Alpha/beta-hydrolase n=1 Tax=Coccomyxa subellipsoidea (strain C-169) TaxID=574566 RepID=I0Z1C0_COCSC|nr:hypothetical protein COCSUDRAFT_35925 [Coccomyxa subellipsoidea C-169]EIE24439.1 hypothetical protein COCSUDRAFT_35925 [Coccomyxa subellipsoidea C-169]|eukprot:XP_005648983.1 hypothetical protein COCSUDRAFT_35925 [Coccomyxa subellipsoidea C-169]